MSTSILLLEDDRLFAESVDDLLSENGYEVTYCSNSKDALNQTFQSKFDLYLLDINVPVLSGTELLNDLRESGDSTPAIFLTSYQDKEMVSRGFLSGCDDYIKKPFDSDELILRIKALLKRQMGDEISCYKELCNDKQHKQIYFHSKELILKQKEYLLLALLIENPCKIVTKEMISEKLWSADESISDGAVRVYINRLKQLLGNEAIENIRGVGYKLVLPS